MVWQWLEVVAAGFLTGALLALAVAMLSFRVVARALSPSAAPRAPNAVLPPLPPLFPPAPSLHSILKLAADEAEKASNGEKEGAEGGEKQKKEQTEEEEEAKEEEKNEEEGPSAGAGGDDEEEERGASASSLVALCQSSGVVEASLKGAHNSVLMASSPASSFASAPAPPLSRSSSRRSNKSLKGVDLAPYALDLVIKSATDLAGANRNGLSDPMVYVSGCGQKFKTKHILNTLNPEWGQSFTFARVQDPERDKILFDVRDYERVGKSKPLGTAVLELGQLSKGKETSMRLPITGLARTDKTQIPATGVLHISVSLWQKDERKPDDFVVREEAGETFGAERERTAERSLPPQSSTPENVDLEDIQDGMESVSDVAVEPGDNSVPLCREGPLQIRSLKVWKQRWFCLLEDGYLLYWKNSKKKKALGMIDFRGCEVKIRVSTLKSVEKEKTRSSVKKGKLRFLFEIVHPARHPIFLRETPDGTTLKSYKAHGRSYNCLLRAESKQEMDDWFYAINYLSHRLLTSEGLFSIPSSAKMVTTPHLNVLLARYFEDLRTSSILRYVLMQKLGSKLAKMGRPPELGPLVLEDFDLGHELKDIFQGMRIVATDVPNELLGEIDIHYTNGVNLRLSTSLIKLNVQIPLVVAIDLNLLVGKLKLCCPSALVAKWWICFDRLPELDVGITLYIDGRKLPVSSLPKLRHWVFHAVQNLVRNRLVWPARLKFRVPFPGQKIEMEIMNATAQPPSTPAAPSKVTPSDVIARHYLATRYFEEILNHRQLHLIEELFTPDCVVYGGLEANGQAANSPLYGTEAVRDHVAAFIAGFSRLRFICENVSAKGQYHAIVQWKARANNDGPFLGLPPNGAEVLLHGVTVNVIRYGNQRIAIQYHYYEGGGISSILSSLRSAA